MYGNFLFMPSQDKFAALNQAPLLPFLHRNVFVNICIVITM